MVATESRRAEIVDLFFAERTKITSLVEMIRASDGATLMHIAAVRLDLHTLMLLQDHLSLVQHLAADNETVLHWALKSAAKDNGDRHRQVGSKLGAVIEVLLEYGAPLDAVTVTGVSAVHLAAESGSEVALGTLLRAAGDQWHDLLYGETDEGYTPLMKAAQKNHSCAMEMILSRKWAKKGASLSFIHTGWNEMNIMNALVVAAEAGHSDILSEFGARVQPRAYQTVDWTLSLLLAAESDDVEITRFLMDKKVPPNRQLAPDHWRHRDFGDASPLLIAAQHGHHGVVALLLAQGTDNLTKPEAQAWFSQRHNSRGPTPLVASIQNSATSLENSLLTAEHLLSFARRMDIVNINETNIGGEDLWFVIAHAGAEVHLDSDGGGAKKSVLEHGQEVGVVEVIEGQVRVEFPEAGYIHLTQPPTIAQQETPLHAAVASGKVELVAKILDHFSDEPKLLSFALEQPEKASLTPLLLAASLHLFEICQLLLQKGADPNARSANLETIFHLIARREGVHDHGLELLAYFTANDTRMNFPREPPVALFPNPSMGSVNGSIGPGLVGEARSPSALNAGLAEVLLMRSQPLDDVPRTALEVACDGGAVTVVKWILQQFRATRKHLTAAQAADLENNCSDGFELAMAKLPLNRPGALQASHSHINLPELASSATLRTSHRPKYDKEEYYVALLNNMLQFGVPVPNSIFHKRISTPEGSAQLFDGTFLEPLEALFRLILKLPPKHFMACEDPAVAADFPISVVSPTGLETLYTTAIAAPTPLSRRKLVVPLHQRWVREMDGEPARASAASHEVMLALSRALESAVGTFPAYGSMPCSRQSSRGSGGVGPRRKSSKANPLEGLQSLQDLPAAPTPLLQLPFQEVELLQNECHEMLEYDGLAIRMDFIETQHGVHVQVQRLESVSDELKFRIKKEKRVVAKRGLLYCYDPSYVPGSGGPGEDGTLVINDNNAVLWYAFYYVSCLERFDLKKWVTSLIDEEAVEFNIEGGWVPLSRLSDVPRGDQRVFTQIHQVQSVVSAPLACVTYDNFFANLARTQEEASFILFSCRTFVSEREDYRNTTPPSSTTSGIFSEALMMYMRYQVLMSSGRPVQPLRELDLTGVTLQRPDEKMMEKWIGIRNGVFSNLSLLRFTSREFGEIEVTPKLGEEANEVRPLSSLLAGNFSMDLKFVTCTSRDHTPRVEYNEAEDSIKLLTDFSDSIKRNSEANLAKAESDLITLVNEEDIKHFLGLSIEALEQSGVRWHTLEDVCNGSDDEFHAVSLFAQKQEVQDKAWAELRRLKQLYGDLTKDNYSQFFSVNQRFDVLLNLMSSRRRGHVDLANEALDFLSTKGRGVQVDLSKFAASGKSYFTFEHTRGLLEYVKRHKAVKSLCFSNLNFVDENEENQEVVLRDFIRTKLLRGLTCEVIDFGKDNKHVGEIFLTASTFSPGDEEDMEEAQNERPVPKTQRSRSFRQSKFFEDGVLPLAPGGAELGLTPLQYFCLEGVPFVVTEALRKYPLHYLLKVLHARKIEAEEPEPISFVNHDAQQLSSIVAERRKETVRQRKIEAYQSVLLVTTKTIQFLNSRDPCYFMRWVKRRCHGISPLRLAIHLQLDEVVKCMIGLQKTQGGLLKRMLHYETERLEFEHFVDLWGCLQRDNEDLLPLHAAIIQVGVVDHDDNVLESGAKNMGGDGQISFGVPRHQQPYQLKNFAHDVSAGHIRDLGMSVGAAIKFSSWRKSLHRGSIHARVTDEGEEADAFFHPSRLIEEMSEVRLLTDRKKLITYVDTSVESDTASLGPRVARSITIAKQLISCGFVERSITVAGNPPPRGCKQYLEVPGIIDKSDGSEFSPNRNQYHKLLLSRTWDRTGINEAVLPEYSGTTLLLALKFAPYVTATLLKWGEQIELVAGFLEPEWLGGIHLQYRRGFTVSNDYCNSDETMLGKVNWREEDVGLNLAHWAAVRDQKRLLERVIHELPDSIYGKSSTSYRTHQLERTALHYGCYAGSLECLNVLLQHLNEKHDGSIGVHALDSEGNSPLHVAASLCHPICTETLLEAGARPYWKNRKASGGLDPHDICIASLLHHTHKEAEFHQHNLIREWERDADILRDQISLMTKDPRIQRKLSLEATKSFLLGALFYMLFLGVLCMVVNNKTNLFRSDGYWKTAAVRGEVMEQEFLYEDAKFFKTLAQVGDANDMFSFLRGPLSQLFFEDVSGAGDDEPSNFLFGILHVVGLVRLRQLRVRNQTCSRPEWVSDYISGCYGGWSQEHELVTGEHWNSTYQSQSDNPSLYTWKSPMHREYPNSGFVKDLDPTSKDEVLAEIDAMRDGNWVDLQTRAVFVEFTLYNPNVHNFIVSKVLFEFPEYGGTVASYRLTNVNLEACIPLFPNTAQLHCDNIGDSLIFFLECGLLVSVAFLTYDELHDMWISWKYVKQIYRDEGKRKLKESKDMEAAKTAERYRKKLGQLTDKPKEVETRKKNLFEKAIKMLFNILAYVWYGLSHYFWREWNLVDLMCVVMFWLVAGTRVLFISELLTFTPQEMVPASTTTREFFDLWPVAALSVAEKELWACVLVLYFVKLLKHIMILPKLGPVATAITTTIGDSKVLIFFVVFMVIALALMMGIHVLLSESSVEFTTFGSTFIAFMEIVFGQWNYSAFQSSWLIGPFLFLLCLFLANLILINVFIAVVGNIYEENLKKSVERWSWQIIDEYQYKLTGLRHPRGSSKSKAMVVLSKALKCFKRIFLREEQPVFDHTADLHWLAPEFPKRLMRKEAVQRLLKSQQRIQINLAEVNENVFSVKDQVVTTAATLERIHEQLDKLDSSVYQLQSAQDDLKRVVYTSPHRFS